MVRNAVWGRKSYGKHMAFQNFRSHKIYNAFLIRALHQQYSRNWRKTDTCFARTIWTWVRSKIWNPHVQNSTKLGDLNLTPQAQWLVRAKYDIMLKIICISRPKYFYVSNIIPTIIRLYSFKRAVLIMERLVFAVRQALDFYTLDTPNLYFRRLCHTDLNISDVKDRLKTKL